jgi:hypothetical protein
MTDRDLRDQPQEPGPEEPGRQRRKRRGLLGGLGRMAQPPLTTPQWKDAVREQDLRGPKKPKRDD